LTNTTAEVCMKEEGMSFDISLGALNVFDLRGPEKTSYPHIFSFGYYNTNEKEEKFTNNNNLKLESNDGNEKTVIQTNKEKEFFGRNGTSIRLWGNTSKREYCEQFTGNDIEVNVRLAEIRGAVLFEYVNNIMDFGTKALEIFNEEPNNNNDNNKSKKEDTKEKEKEIGNKEIVKEDQQAKVIKFNVETSKCVVIVSENERSKSLL